MYGNTLARRSLVSSIISRRDPPPYTPSRAGKQRSPYELTGTSCSTAYLDCESYVQHIYQFKSCHEDSCRNVNAVITGASGECGSQSEGSEVRCAAVPQCYRSVGAPPGCCLPQPPGLCEAKAVCIHKLLLCPKIYSHVVTQNSMCTLQISLSTPLAAKSTAIAGDVCFTASVYLLAQFSTQILT